MMTTTEGYKAIRQSAATFARGTRIVEVTGPGRHRLLSHVLARPTEYVQPGAVLESLALDDHGRAADLILCIVDESRAILLSDTQVSVLDDLAGIAQAIDIEDVTVSSLPTWSAAAIEGPKSWRAVADLPGEDIAGVLLNEWREIKVPLSSSPAFLVRSGGTSEYGYVVVAETESEVLLDWLTNLAANVGGEHCSMDAIMRARVEANHPVLEGQFDGLNVYEAGAAWMAGMERDDSFRGAMSDVEPPTRRLVAVVASRDLASGEEVRAGERVVGRIQLVAPRVGQPTVIALALLEAPFDVPGLVLMAADIELRTVARPAVNPISWIESID